MISTKLSVIIVSYNTEDALNECLSSVLANSANLDIEIFVIDNASVDDSVEMVRREFPAVNLVGNITNMGFSSACNQALRVARGEYILLLNPDTVVSENTLERLMGYMEKHQGVGIIGCKILKENGRVERSAFPKPSLFNEINDILSKYRIERLFPPSFTRRKYDRLAELGVEPFNVHWVCGACLMIRKKTMDEIGLLDENFFLFSEDVDWCCRAKEKGWEVIYHPGTNVIHHVGLSAKTNMEALRNRIYFSYIRRLYFTTKYFDKTAILILKVIILMDLLLSILIAEMRRDIPSIRRQTIVKTYKEVLKSLFTSNNK